MQPYSFDLAGGNGKERFLKWRNRMVSRGRSGVIIPSASSFLLYSIAHILQEVNFWFVKSRFGVMYSL